MVLLDIEMPGNCAECPCYETLHLYNDTLVRRCAVKGIILKSVMWKEGDPEPDDKSWCNFTKPVWCPLKLCKPGWILPF